ncbi:thermonuclease family protein [Sporolactobacillus terrae]|uniref:thermonuclease family protein n=1 Tax=Sporolactobacillus terrae TaxID=269673 RepID=UPI001CC1B31E|nr:thermonuclease family protein [Sporolactobacillus terrae]UAK17600.1 thermonuclease family protein [Sporolactobacillus terrae]
MKRITALLLSILISISLVACSSTSATDNSDSSSTVKTESVAKDSSSASSNSSSSADSLSDSSSYSSQTTSVDSSSSQASKPKTAADAVKELVTATVTKEVDGDTLHVNFKGKDETIRMLLIDTPETHKPGTPVQPFGIKASAFAVGQMPVGTKIKLEIGKKGYERDKYGRLLAFIYLPNGQLYNEKIVRKGLARVAYIYPPNTQHLDKLNAAQNYAKNNKLGIWSINGYVTDSGFNTPKAAGTVKKKDTTTSSNNNSSNSSSQKSVAVTPKKERAIK